MAAIHGRNGKLYVDVQATPTNDGTVTSIPFLADYSLDQSADRVETTSFGDTTKTYVAGLKDASGSLSGFYNDASNDIYTVGDGVARDFYLYIDDTDATTRSPISTGKGYWYGAATFDVSTSGGVGDAVKLTINWSASESITKL